MDRHDRAEEAKGREGKRPYKKPTLEKREKLSQVAATTPTTQPLR